MSGIGGDSGNRDTDFSGEDAGTLTIHGGIITAIGSQDYYSRYGGAGIGEEVVAVKLVINLEEMVEK